MTCRCAHGCLWYVSCLDCAAERERDDARRVRQTHMWFRVTGSDRGVLRGTWMDTGPPPVVWTDIGSTD
jgi:hypothetical protein